jgi:hypothetical protein
MDETRYYEITDGWGPDSTCVRWGLSRFGERHDDEMFQAIAALHTPGDGKSLRVSFTPSVLKMQSTDRVLAQRIRNMKARAEKMPLLADQIIARELEREYFSKAEVERNQAERKAYYEKFEALFWEKHPESLRIVLPEVKKSDA